MNQVVLDSHAAWLDGRTFPLVLNNKVPVSGGTARFIMANTASDNYGWHW